MMNRLVIALIVLSAESQITQRSVPRLADQTSVSNSMLIEDQHEAEHHVFANDHFPIVSSPRQVALRGLGSAERNSSSVEAIAGKSIPQLIDDFNDLEEMDAPDIWDILIWIGAWIGRVTRTIIVGIIKLCYALYTGMAYGWESAKPDSGPTAR